MVGRKFLSIVAVAGALVACSTDSSSQARASKEAFLPAGGAGYLVPDAAPSGWRLRSLAVSDRGEGPSTTESVTVFGEPDRADPLSGPLYLATTRPAGEIEPFESGPTVHGKSGTVDAVVYPNDLHLSPSLSWPEKPDVAVVLWGRGTEFQDLEAVAQGIRIDDRGRPVAKVLPDGLAQVGKLEDEWRWPPRGVQIVWTTDVDANRARNPSVTVARAAPEEVLSFRALLKDEPSVDYSVDEGVDIEGMEPPEQLDIGGHRAWVGMVAPTTRVLVVEGDPGAVLISNGDEHEPRLPTHEELALLASNLRPLAATEVQREAHRADESLAAIERERLYSYYGQPVWVDAYGDRRRTLHSLDWDRDTQSPSGGAAVPSYCFFDTPELFYAGDGQSAIGCVQVVDNDLTASSVISSDQDVPLEQRHENLWGVVSSRVVRVLVELPGLPSQETPLIPTGRADPPALFVFRLPDDLERTPYDHLRENPPPLRRISIVAYGADGAELGRVTTDANGLLAGIPT